MVGRCAICKQVSSGGGLCDEHQGFGVLWAAVRAGKVSDWETPVPTHQLMMTMTLGSRGHGQVSWQVQLHELLDRKDAA